MLKQFKIIILAATCFGSHNTDCHNIDCVYIDEHKKKHFVVLAKHRTAP